MCKFNCRFVNKIIIFLKALQFKDVFIFYYNRQNVIKISEKVSLFITTHFKNNFGFFSLAVNACVLNQPNGHWLLSYALQSTI
jgi:hypothetical protein